VNVRALLAPLWSQAICTSRAVASPFMLFVLLMLL